MPPILVTLLPQLIQLIPSITQGFGHFLDFISKTRDAAKQTGEWTDEMENNFSLALLARLRNNAYKTDEELAKAVILK